MADVIMWIKLGLYVLELMKNKEKGGKLSRIEVGKVLDYAKSIGLGNVLGKISANEFENLLPEIKDILKKITDMID